MIVPPIAHYSFGIDSLCFRKEGTFDSHGKIGDIVYCRTNPKLHGVITGIYCDIDSEQATWRIKYYGTWGYHPRSKFVEEDFLWYEWTQLNETDKWE
jgi:hypothetical protein